MNALTQTTATDWINALGWTLLHSLWQSLIIFLFIAGIFRLATSLSSSIRYTIACAGLVFTTLFSVATFIVLSSESTPVQSAVFLETGTYHTAAPNAISSQDEGLITSVVTGLEQTMPWLVMLWGIGFFMFTLRDLIGLFATYSIRSKAKPIDGEWAAYIQRMAYGLGIPKIIRIAESTHISGPMVMGYFKPLILIPVGMIGGLSTQQLETIFLHELAHVRRHDYLVNLLQIIVESIFFFNPFVRMLSNTIRREREYCCDDVVVARHGNTSAYAHALVSLAEKQMASPIVVLSLAANKNELLNRIKRIMERSTLDHRNKRQVLIPAVLLMAAFACVSWIGAERVHDKPEPSISIMPVSTIDAAPENDGFIVRYSRRSIITIDENGQPHEAITQEFQGDEGLMSIDSIPPFAREEWDAFADAFNREFREEFRSLFEGNGDSLKEFQEGDIFRNFREEFEKFRSFSGEEMERFRENFRSFDHSVEAYERALRDELIQDGYLSPGDQIESLEWSDESFKVNGEPLRREDIKKYNDLRKNMLERN